MLRYHIFLGKKYSEPNTLPIILKDIAFRSFVTKKKQHFSAFRSYPYIPNKKVFCMKSVNRNSHVKLDFQLLKDLIDV